MLRSTKAIVRRQPVAGAVLEPGCVVWVSDLAFEGNGKGDLRFPATPEASPEPLMWLSPQDLLPICQFLHRQPFRQHWMLVSRPRRSRRNVGRFLSDPWHQRFGSEPFRFESLGEVLYYVRNSTLQSRELQVGHFGDLEDPVQPS